MRQIHPAGLLLFTVYGAMFSCATGGAAEDSWKFVRQDQGVEIYQRPFDNSRIPELRGHTHFDASIGEVYSVISDYDHFSDFIPMVSESRILKRNAQTIWVYQRLGMPLPISDRHYIIKVVDDLQDAPNGVIDVSWQMDNTRSMSHASNNAIMPAAFSGSWHLQDHTLQGNCDAVYTIHVDPAGTLPRWLFVRLSERYVIQVMNAVRKRIGVNNE